jgi:hypothetical protein
MPELIILIKGIGAASRSVCVFFLLWFIITYVFAVVFRQMSEGSDLEERFFPTVPVAMNTLLLDGIMPESSYIVNAVAAESPLYWLAMMFFIGLSGVTVMYMLVGVLVDVVGVIAATEKEALTVQTIAHSLRDKFTQLGRDPEAHISKYEFEQIVSMPEISFIVDKIGVDATVLADMVEIIYDDPNMSAAGLEFHEFVNIVLDMRGKNAAKVKDVKSLIRVFKSMLRTNLNQLGKTIHGDLATIKTELWEMKALAAMREGDEDDDPLYDDDDGGGKGAGAEHFGFQRTETQVDAPNFTGLVKDVSTSLKQKRAADE